MSEEKVTLREALHKLGNKHHLLILVPGLLRAKLEQIMEKHSINRDVSDDFNAVLDKLKDLETIGKEADRLLKKIKQPVYERINPDEVTLDIESEPK